MNQSLSRAGGVRGIYAAMLFDGLCVSSASLVIPLLRERYGVDYHTAGILLAVLSAGNLAAAALCGFLPRVWGVRRTMLVFVAGLAAGYLALLASGAPPVLLCGFLLIGLGKGAAMNNAVVITGSASSDKTRSVNLINALFALGSLASPFVYLACARASFWGAPLAALALSGGVVWGLFARASGAAPSSAQGRAAAKDDLSFLKSRRFWFTVAFLFANQCVEISVTSWLVTYFRDTRILSAEASGLTVTVIWSAMLTGRLTIAFALRPQSRLRSLVLMSVATALTYVLLLFARSGVAAVAALALFGLADSGAYPTAIAKANSTLSNASVGVLLPVAGIGAVVMPYVTGAVAEAVGIRGGMLCVLAACALMIVFSALIKLDERRGPS